MKDDEVRAKEQLTDINKFLVKAKSKMREHKLPIVPIIIYSIKRSANAIKEVTKIR